MARHTSIFLNMQDYREQVPESQRFHLSDVQDPGFLNSDRIGREKCVQLIQEYIKIRFSEITF